MTSLNFKSSLLEEEKCDYDNQSQIVTDYPISKMRGNLFTIRSLAILRWFNRFYIFDSFEINDVIVYFSSTVELALTSNSPQKPFHLVPAGSPYIDSCLTS